MSIDLKKMRKAEAAMLAISRGLPTRAASPYGGHIIDQDAIQRDARTAFEVLRTARIHFQSDKAKEPA